MTSKIRIKMGPIEIEYEGSETFLKVELPELLKAVSNLYKESGLAGKRSLETTEPLGGAGIDETQATQFEATTNSIAAKLQCKTGSTLIMAAAARLTFVLDKEKFSRDDLFKEMQTASGYYKKTYGGGNLTKYLNRLIKNGKLNEPSKNNYSLSASMKSELCARIA